MKRIAILGSTGSIGIQALEVIREHPEEFSVAAVCCHNSIDLLERQIKEFRVPVAAVFNEKAALELKHRVRAQVYAGMEGLEACASLDGTDMVLNALVGSVGIRPTIAAIGAGKAVALANKETLVAAGPAVMEQARRHNVPIYPVDSEHSAIFQCLNGRDGANVRRLVLTCSGGAFREKSREELESMTPADALRHPVWNMGSKITIDSATLMNKGLEVIEASMLFDIGYDRIDVVIHPQSIIHSLVEFVDASMLAQMSHPDMRLPIQYALTYPARRANGFRHLDLAALSRIDFAAPDTERFPCLDLAYRAGRAGGTAPCAMNAANEMAVAAFMDGKIGFTDIPRVIENTLDSHRFCPCPDIGELLELDHQVKSDLSRSLKLI